MTRRLEGTYVSIDEAMQAVKRLKDQGYGRNDIHVIADKAVRDSIPFTLDAEVSSATEVREEERDDERSFWEKLKDAFTFSEYRDEDYMDPTRADIDDPLEAYRNDLAAGKVVVLVDEDDNAGIPPTNPLLRDDIPADSMNPDLTTNDMRTEPPLDSDWEDRKPPLAP